MITDAEIAAIKPLSTVMLEGKDHLIGSVSWDEDPDTQEIIRAAVWSITDQRWIFLRAPEPIDEDEHDKSCPGCSYCKPHPGSSPRP